MDYDSYIATDPTDIMERWVTNFGSLLIYQNASWNKNKASNKQRKSMSFDTPNIFNRNFTVEKGSQNDCIKKTKLQCSRY